MLRWRLLASALILVPLLTLITLDFRWNFHIPGLWLSPLALLLVTLAVSEVLDLLASKNLRPVGWTVYGGAMLIVVAAMVPMLWGLPVLWGRSGKPYPADCPIGPLGLPLAAAALALPLAFFGEMRRFQAPGQSIVHVAVGLLTTYYAGLPIAFLIALRTFHSNAWGMAALVSFIFVVKMSDTGAYFFGRTFGRTKMTPILSPKKTVEGAIGGLLTAAACSWLFFQFLVPAMVGPDAPATPLWGCLLYGLILGIAGMIGDLSESLLKRDMERKDSSSWMPGLGGVLDVLDSLMLAAPPAFLCWACGLVGP